MSRSLLLGVSEVVRRHAVLREYSVCTLYLVFLWGSTSGLACRCWRQMKSAVSRKVWRFVPRRRCVGWNKLAQDDLSGFLDARWLHRSVVFQTDSPAGLCHGRRVHWSIAGGHGRGTSTYQHPSINLSTKSNQMLGMRKTLV
ncbi:uncharacterized protein CC84DRAFT_184850 [Paraphaeosphaeria sporulosa]|uniref:Uncharacterized protein n=1 Tax=Paraphaeosphaeria sporulosa TaxID=1460663 RepID=A0A177D2C1_9PLEO|nr:uncharacterized protein CC84DRAFT_184850 [Paraphaeosphaeria sporulosa]OAG13169.1 hypothetical protein CC84DRAFT_184850 [Paraphaeosphaeria sporulosa]